MNIEEFTKIHLTVCNAKRRERSKKGHHGRGRFRETLTMARRRCAKNLYESQVRLDIPLNPLMRNKELKSLLTPR